MTNHDGIFHSSEMENVKSINFQIFGTENPKLPPENSKSPLFLFPPLIFKTFKSPLVILGLKKAVSPPFKRGERKLWTCHYMAIRSHVYSQTYGVQHIYQTNNMVAHLVRVCVSLCVYICVNQCVCVSVWVHVCMYVWGRGAKKLPNTGFSLKDDKIGKVQPVWCQS